MKYVLNTREKISLNGSVSLAAEDLGQTIHVSLEGCSIHRLSYHHLTCFMSFLYSL